MGRRTLYLAAIAFSVWMLANALPSGLAQDRGLDLPPAETESTQHNGDAARVMREGVAAKSEQAHPPKATSQSPQKAAAPVHGEEESPGHASGGEEEPAPPVHGQEAVRSGSASGSGDGHGAAAPENAHGGENPETSETHSSQSGDVPLTDAGDGVPEGKGSGLIWFAATFLILLVVIFLFT